MELIQTIHVKAGQPLLVDVIMNQRPLMMELDTAAVSLVSEEIYQTLLSDMKLEQAKSSLRIILVNLYLS